MRKLLSAAEPAASVRAYPDHRNAAQDPLDGEGDHVGRPGHRRGPGSHRHVGRQRPELDAIRQRDGARCRSRLHQTPHRRRNPDALDPSSALVSINPTATTIIILMRKKLIIIIRVPDR